MQAAPIPLAISEDRLAALAKALGHPARVRILRLLGVRATCVTGELAPELGLAASTVSEHLRILRQAGLIETESADGRRCYCLSDDGLRSLIAGVSDLGRVRGQEDAPPEGRSAARPAYGTTPPPSRQQ
jgi:ArsR family transcriptional regulator, arsenate/arsenite/antimonite-responsive transcriptional repressor